MSETVERSAEYKRLRDAYPGLRGAIYIPTEEEAAHLEGYNGIRAEYYADPGTIESQDCPDGKFPSLLFEGVRMDVRWCGGPVARVSPELAPTIQQRIEDGEYPWPLDFVLYDPFAQIWYVRRIDDGEAPDG